jgi:GTP pyrophosphokinase
MRAAAYLVYAGDYLQKPEEVVAKAFGESYAGLVAHTRKLVQIQRAAREAQVEAEQRAQQTERVRKMLLAFSRDLRVVLLRLASRLQTLRWHAASKVPARHCWRRRASRCLRRWPTAWASGRSSGRWRTWPSASCSPADYKRLAQALAEKRVQRETGIEAARARLQAELAAAGMAPRCRAGPSTCTASGRRCRARAWRSTGCSTCARCG